MTWTRRDVLAVAIATSITGTTRMSLAQTPLVSAVAALCPTGKLRAALIVSNPVLVTRRSDGTLGGVSVTVARALAAHLGVPTELKPYDNPARYGENLETDDWDIGLPRASFEPTTSRSAAPSWRWLMVMSPAGVPAVPCRPAGRASRWRREVHHTRCWAV